MDNTVLKFIREFQSPPNRVLFTECACYWFSYIMRGRFGGKIMYNPNGTHFATNINGKLYDITGEIDSEGYEEWESYEGPDRDLVEKACVLL